jgi:hypothetical protein
LRETGLTNELIFGGFAINELEDEALALLLLSDVIPVERMGVYFYEVFNYGLHVLIEAIAYRKIMSPALVALAHGLLFVFFVLVGLRSVNERIDTLVLGCGMKMLFDALENSVY